MEIIRVPDILIYRGGSLHSLREQQIVKGGELHTFGNGSGVVKDGKLYVLDGEDCIVRMVTGKKQVLFGITNLEPITLDWGDGTIDLVPLGNQNVSHDYTDISQHKITIKGTVNAIILLACSLIELTELEIKSNVLTELQCAQNKLKSLIIEQCPELSILDCNNNLLTSLDISKNTELTNLSCGRNQLISLDVSTNNNLAYISCYINKLNIVTLVNTFPDRSGQRAGQLYINATDDITTIETICAAKNWEVTVY